MGRIITICTVLSVMAGTAFSRPADYFIAGTHSYGSIADMPYRFFVPYDYREGVHYPLVLTLHGGGGTGDDNWTHITYNNNVSEVWATMERQEATPCFVLSPQNHTGTGDWYRLISCIFDLIEKLREDGYRFDPNRIYVCGISWGGRGTFHALNSTVSRDWTFACGVPMCGSATSSYMANIPDDMPIWNFHSQNDDVVSVGYSRSMVAAFAERGETFAHTHCTGTGRCGDPMTASELDALVASGEDHVYSELCCAGHALQNTAFAIPQLFDWIFSKTNDDMPPGNPVGLTGTGGTARSISFSWQAPAAADDGDTATGYLVYRDGVLVGSARGTSFTDSTVSENTAYDYAVYALDYSLRSTGAAAGNLTSAADNGAPGVSGTLVYGLTELEVIFDESVDSATAADPTNYSVSGGVAVTGAELTADGRTVLLTTTLQTDGTAYTLTLDGIRDVSTAGNAIAAGTETAFTAAVRFRDDFERNGYDAWTPASSDFWSIGEVAGDKTLYLSGYGAPPLVVDRYYRTVTVDLDVRGVDNNDTFRNFCLIFGYQDDDNYYFMNVCGNTAFTVNGFFRVHDGIRDKMEDGPVGVWNDDVSWHHARLVHDVHTGDISLYWDGRDNRIMHVNDRTFTGGKIGLWSLMNKRVHFDDVEITRTRNDEFPTSGIGAADGSRTVLPAFSVRNPADGTVTFPVRDGAMVRIYDGTGRPMAVCGPVWDGKDASGRPVPAGAYLYAADTPAGTAAGRFIFVE